MVPVFILGLYKSGTSWLLNCLCAHPQFRGLREIDVVRATLAPEADNISQLRPRKEWLRGIFTRNSWGTLEIDKLLDDGRLVEGDLARRLSELAAASGSPLARNADMRARRFDRPLGFGALTADEAAMLIRVLGAAKTQLALIHAFVSLQANYFGDPPYFVVKAADGMIGIDLVRAAFAAAKIVAIVRDGRDATISAIHFRRFRAERGFPGVRILSFDELLEAWAQRALAVAAAAEAGKLAVIRYEDLSRDFLTTFGRLLDWFGADSDPSLVRAIGARTSFEAVTGRQRGEAAVDAIRKGALGEWIEVLSDRQKARAWALAGPMLRRFGYSRAAAIEAAFPGKL